MPSKTPVVIAGVVIFLFCLGGLGATETPEGDAAANRAKNLARLNCGAHIDRILPGGTVVTVPVADEGDDNPAALVLDDNTLSCPLPVGESIFIITLPKIAVLQRFAFINQNAAGEGEFDLAVSNYRLGSTDPKWVPVQTATRFSGQRLINLPVMGAEAKYVKIAFHVRKEGRLAGVALYGSRTLDGFAERHVLRAQTSFSLGAMKLIRHTEETLNFNYANQYARAHVAYVSSGATEGAPRMIDDDVATSFSFAQRDAHPTVIVALANHQTLHRVSAVYQMQQGQVEVYLLDDLPANPGDLTNARLIATVTDQKGEGKAAIDFDPHGARYVALRWTPKKAATRPFEVAEIAAFGTLPLSVLDLDEIPNAFAQTFKPGEGGQDLSNRLGTLAIPPTFGIIPTITPVSP
jgi:hypothetical protein